MNIQTSDPLRLETLTRSMLEEMMMALVGRSAPEPRRFRAWLQGLSYEQLANEYQKVMEET